jgi:nucleoside-diphosphate-sugar epimerase
MRCLVTGVAGFVGSTLAEKLIAEGHEVVGVDMFTDYYPRVQKEANLTKLKDEKKFTFIEKNLLTMDLEKLLTGVNYIFHQAGQPGVRASWGKTFEGYTDNNISLTQKLLEVTTQYSTENPDQFKKFIFASSSSIYGDAETFPTSETAVPNPVSPYGVTKLASEHLTTLYSKNFNLPVTALRYFTVYGPRQRPDMSFHRFFRAAFTGEEITVYGDGEQTRNFTFVSDIVEANYLAATTTTKSKVFNIGGGSQVSVNQVLELVKDISGKKLHIQYKNAVSGDARHTGADTTLAKNELGFQAKVSLREGLEKEARWVETAIAGGILV